MCFFKGEAYLLTLELVHSPWMDGWKDRQMDVRMDGQIDFTAKILTEIPNCDISIS